MIFLFGGWIWNRSGLGRGCGILYNVSNTSFCYDLVNEDMLCNDVLVCVGDEWNEAPFKIFGFL